MKARESVRFLADLQPEVVAAGHGTPVHEAAGRMRALADAFPIPSRGRYAHEPALADETGVTYLPPRPADPVPAIVAGATAGILVAGATAAIVRRRRGNR